MVGSAIQRVDYNPPKQRGKKALVGVPLFLRVFFKLLVSEVEFE